MRSHDLGKGQVIADEAAYLELPDAHDGVPVTRGEVRKLESVVTFAIDAQQPGRPDKSRRVVEHCVARTRFDESNLHVNPGPAACIRHLLQRRTPWKLRFLHETATLSNLIGGAEREREIGVSLKAGLRQDQDIHSPIRGFIDKPQYPL